MSLSDASPRRDELPALMKALRAGIHGARPTVSAAMSVDLRQEHHEGRDQPRAVLYLPSQGCSWARGPAGGCTVCGHLSRQLRDLLPLDVGEYVAAFDALLARFDLDAVGLLDVYNNGSFFDDRELPAPARRAILARIAAEPRIRRVVVESRPEHATGDCLREFSSWLAPRHLEVAVGLDVASDRLREQSLNKCFRWADYEAAAERIRSACHLRTYALLKPPFVAEAEAVEEAVRTIRAAFAVGSTTVSLEACTAQPDTLPDLLFEAGVWAPPSLWSIVEVVLRTAGLGKLVVGMFQFHPSPRAVPHACERCTPGVLAALDRYNRTLEPKPLAALDCDCRAIHQRAAATEPEPDRAAQLELAWATLRARTESGP
jgi:hypothetical protein